MHFDPNDIYRRKRNDFLGAESVNCSRCMPQTKSSILKLYFYSNKHFLYLVFMCINLVIP